MPPSEPPRSSRSKKRKPRPAQPPSSTARQGAAFGSRPARPLPKPAPAPRAPRPQAPTPQQVRNARAQRAAIVSSAKAVDRGAYKQKTVKQRRQITYRMENSKIPNDASTSIKNRIRNTRRTTRNGR